MDRLFWTAVWASAQNTHELYFWRPKSESKKYGWKAVQRTSSLFHQPVFGREDGRQQVPSSVNLVGGTRNLCSPRVQYPGYGSKSRKSSKSSKSNKAAKLPMLVWNMQKPVGGMDGLTAWLYQESITFGIRNGGGDNGVKMNRTNEKRGQSDHALTSFWI